MKKFIVPTSFINAEGKDGGAAIPENTQRTIGGNHSSYQVTSEYLNTSTSRSAKINNSAKKKYAKSISHHQQMLSSTDNSQAVKNLMQKVPNDVTFANGDQSAREEYIQKLNNLFTSPQPSNLFPPTLQNRSSPKNDQESINMKQSQIIQSIINEGGLSSYDTTNGQNANKLTNENLNKVLKNHSNVPESLISNSQIFQDFQGYYLQKDKGKFSKRIAVSPTPSQKKINKKLEGSKQMMFYQMQTAYLFNPTFEEQQSSKLLYYGNTLQHSKNLPLKNNATQQKNSKIVHAEQAIENLRKSLRSSNQKRIKTKEGLMFTSQDDTKQLQSSSTQLQKLTTFNTPDKIEKPMKRNFKELIQQNQQSPMNYREMNQHVVIDENYMLKKYSNLAPIIMTSTNGHNDQTELRVNDEDDQKKRTPPATSTYKNFRNSMQTQKYKKKEIISIESQGMPQIATFPHQGYHINNNSSLDKKENANDQSIIQSSLSFNNSAQPPSIFKRAAVPSETKNYKLMNLRHQKNQLPRRTIYQKGFSGAESPHKQYKNMVAYDPKTDINYQEEPSIVQMSKTLNKNQIMHKSSQYFKQGSVDEEQVTINPQQCFKFQVVKGNNSSLVTKILSNKPGWVDVLSMPSYQGLAHFKWSPCSVKSDFQRPSFEKYLYNHFEYHREITRKNDLFTNLSSLCNHNGENVYDLVPLTFHVFISAGKAQENLDVALKKFDAIFATFEINKSTVQQEMMFEAKNQLPRGGSSMLDQNNNEVLAMPQFETKQLTVSLCQEFANIEAKVNMKQSIRNQFPKNSAQRMTLPLSHFIGANMWVLKTTSQNRGRGIHVFRSLKQLRTILKQTFIQAAKSHEITDPMLVYKGRTNSTITSTMNISNLILPKPFNFVIQKYIERPLLINNRKFDIRVWVLLTQELEVFFFKEGYLRTSSAPYKIDDGDDPFIHLTNNAVQKNASCYGQFEDGNQLSFKDLQRYINENYSEYKIDVQRDLVEDMKYLVNRTIESVRSKITGSSNLDMKKGVTGCFEILGFDFMVDQDFTVWLIECNTNPCIEESSGLLKCLLPRMLDDAFKLTLDKQFPQVSQPSKNGGVDSQHCQKKMKDGNKKKSGSIVPSASEVNDESENHLQKKRGSFSNENKKKHGTPSPYYVEGYSSNVNMWEKIYDLTNSRSFNKVQERRIRSKTMVYASDTQDLYLTSLESIKQFYKQELQNRSKYKPTFGQTSNAGFQVASISGASRQIDQRQLTSIGNGFFVNKKQVKPLQKDLSPLLDQSTTAGTSQNNQPLVEEQEDILSITYRMTKKTTGNINQ